MSEHSLKERNEERGRVRRPADLSLAVLAFVVAASLLGVAHGLPIGTRELTENVASWVTQHVPRVVALFLASLVDLGCAVLAALAAVAVVRTDSRDARNAIVAFLCGIGISTAFAAEWRARPGGVATAMLRGTDATMLVLAVAFVAFLTDTDLVRRPRWTRWCVLAPLGLLVSELALDDLTFFAMLIAPLAGWSIGLAVRWLLGAASVRPGAEGLASWLRHSDIAVASLDAPAESGSFAGVLTDGTHIHVLFANRDTRGSGVARKLWSSFRLRAGSRGSEVLSSRSQLEHQALASYTAEKAGVLAPRVLTLAEMPPETLVLALSTPSGSRLEMDTSFDKLVGLFVALRSLHRAGVAHRDLRAVNVLVGPLGAGFSSMARAETGGGELVRRLDIAQLLTTLASVVGAAQAVKALREGYQPEDESAVAAILQPVALAPWGWSAMREARGCLAEVRLELVGPGVSAPPVLRLERFKWRTVVTAVAVTFAAFLLIGQFSKVNLLGALEAMNPLWFLVALVGSALTYFGAALNLAAFVPKRLSLVRGFYVQLASAFVGVAMPPTVGHVAINSRYLHRQGVDEGAIAAAVAVSQIVNVVSTLAILLVIGLLTGSGVSRFKLVPGADLLIGVGSVLAVLAGLAAVPKTRALLTSRIWPHVRAVIPRLLEALSQPLRLAVGLAGNLLLTIGYVAALIAALRAFGAHPPVLATAAVYLAGNAVGSIAPTPGGVGAIEAVLSAGLTAIGIPAHESVPAVLLFRTATFWLPIPAGWASYFFLQKSGTL